MKAERRHHTVRLKAKRGKYSGKGHVMFETPAACSCWMCGNPRKFFGERTVQERRMTQAGLA